MSHIFKEIGKVFSKVWDFVRPIVEVVAIAAAVYFTAGVALSYFPATAGFAAAMPGFASTGGIAGEGVFSSLASSIGMGGGIASGAAADAAAAAVPALSEAGIAGAVTTAGADLPTAAVAGEAGSASAGAAAAGGAVANATPLAAYAPSAAAESTAASLNAANLASAATTASAGGASAASALTNKLLLASVGTQLISGLSSPSPTDIAAAKAGFYGSFYGKDSGGSGPASPNLFVGPQTEPMPGVNVPGVQPSTPAPGVPGFQGPQTAQLIPTVPVGAKPVPGAANSNAVHGTTPLSTPRLITTNA